MFTIRQAQMEAFEAHMRERFIEKTLAHLAEVFPQKTRAHKPKTLKAFVETGLEQAAQYQIAGEREVMLFIDLKMELGPDFAQQPKYQWIENTLRNPKFTERQKIDVIYARLEATAPKA